MNKRAGEIFVTLSLIKKDKSLKIKAIKISFLIFLLATLFFVFFTDQKLVMLICILGMLITGVMMNLTKNYIKIGKALLEKDQITLSFDDSVPRLISISEISTIKFITTEYVGESYFPNPSFFSKKGVENYLNFKTGETVIELQVLLTGKSQFTLLNKLLNDWQKGYEIKVT